MKKILLIGKNSFVSSKLFFVLPSQFIADRISHSDIDNIQFNNYDIIINYALHPLLRSESYREEFDIDLKIIKNFKGHYITYSSRKVYGSSNNLVTYTEESSLNPTDYYSHNKVVIENNIKYYCEKYTILRATNIFGFEYGRNSFMGYLMKQLKTSGDILFDISPYTIRDFISVEDIVNLTNFIIAKNITGVYNLSSGVGELTGNVAKNLIKGYGKGDIISKSKTLKDQFILDNTKIFNALQIEQYNFDYSEKFQELGKQLCRI